LGYFYPQKEKSVDFDKKNGFGYVLGYFFTSSSGRPSFQTHTLSERGLASKASFVLPLIFAPFQSALKKLMSEWFGRIFWRFVSVEKNGNKNQAPTRA
jgi:hypothetical protein